MNKKRPLCKHLHITGQETQPYNVNETQTYQLPLRLLLQCALIFITLKNIRGIDLSNDISVIFVYI